MSDRAWRVLRQLTRAVAARKECAAAYLAVVGTVDSFCWRLLVCGYTADGGTNGQRQEHLANLLLDRTVRLAVTGLSGAGKTVFITSVLHNLLSAAHADRKSTRLNSSH